MSDETLRNPSRRDVLNALGASALVGALSVPSSAAAQDESGLFDVSYSSRDFGLTSIDEAFGLRDEIVALLGPGVAEDVHVVQDTDGHFGIIYDRDGDQASSKRVAASHARTLVPHGFKIAVDIQDSGYHRLWNVAFGKGANLDALKRDYAEVEGILGDSIRKQLVIEKRNDGEFALVYKRSGDHSGAASASQRLAGLLRSGGYNNGATPIVERNNDVIFGESSHLDEVIQRERVQRVERSTPRVVAATSGDLEAEIERYIAGQRRAGRVSDDEHTSWSVYDFLTGDKLVSINEDVPRQCASMVKPLVALAFMHEVNRGRLTYGPQSRANLEASIQRSSNGATNWLMRAVGGPLAVQRVLQREYGHVVPDTQIVEYIPTSGRTYRNKASAHDYSRFLFQLWNGNLPQSRELRRVMALPGRDRIYSGASRVPTGTGVWNKTGSTAMLCGDMGILSARGRDGARVPYTIIGIIEKDRRTGSYGSWISTRGNVIRGVSNIVYGHMKARHDLV